MSENQAAAQPETDSGKITCQICGEESHVMSTHIRDHHPERFEEAEKAVAAAMPGMDVNSREYKLAVIEQVNEQYQAEFAGAPVLSQAAIERVQARKNANKQKQEQAQSVAVSVNDTMELRPMHEVFNLTRSRHTRDASGQPIMVECMKKGHEFEYMVPTVDPDYIWDIDLLKTIVMAVENKIPAYFWGLAGVGKSTGFKQYCASTNRPMIRAQHTGDTESAHIIGQTLANENGTYFEPGPLATAMRYGFFYLADEYDFAFPQVTSVYQPVLENEPLFIKEAELNDADPDSSWRVVKPHPNFYMAGTGNTNGAGDETGLFQGTNIQNAANYERFGIVREVLYMDARKETRLVAAKTGLDSSQVEPIIRFVNEIRDAYRSGKITNTAGQRVSLYMAKLYMLQGNYTRAAYQSLINRLPEGCRKVSGDIAQRIFGD